MNPGFQEETRVVVDGGVGHALEIWTDGVGGLGEAPAPWSPDSRFLAFISADRGVIVAENDQTTDQYDGRLQQLGEVLDCWIEWSPDSQFLYGGTPNGCAGVVVVPVASPGSSTIITSVPGTASWRAARR
jgi:hypothetical protein